MQKMRAMRVVVSEARSWATGASTRPANVMEVAASVAQFASSAIAQTHPDQAAFRIQAWNVQMFHVEHLNIGRQCSDLVVRTLALHRHPDAAGREPLTRQRDEVGQRGKGTRGNEVEPPRHALHPRVLGM